MAAFQSALAGISAAGENEMLIQSEILLERQKERIRELRESEKSKEKEVVDARKKFDAEELKLREANAKLRVEVDMLQAEILAREASLRPQVKLRRLAEALSRSEREKNEALDNLSQARTEIKRLSNTLETKTPAIVEEAKKGENDMTNRLRHAGLLLEALEARQQEARFASSAVADAEFQLLQAKDVIARQRHQLLTLQREVDNARIQSGDKMVRIRNVIKSVYVRGADGDGSEMSSQTDLANVEKKLNRLIEQMERQLNSTSTGGTDPAAALQHDLGRQSEMLQAVTLALNQLAEQKASGSGGTAESGNHGGFAFADQFLELAVQHTCFSPNLAFAPKLDHELVDYVDSERVSSLTRRYVRVRPSEVWIFNLDDVVSTRPHVVPY